LDCGNQFDDNDADAITFNDDGDSFSPENFHMTFTGPTVSGGKYTTWGTGY